MGLFYLRFLYDRTVKHRCNLRISRWLGAHYFRAGRFYNVSRLFNHIRSTCGRDLFCRHRANPFLWQFCAALAFRALQGVGWQATAVNLRKWRRSKYKYSIDLQRLLHILPTKGRAQNTLVASNMKNHTLA